MAPIKALILDWGNVLLPWTPSSDKSISKTLMKQVMSSGIWADYERGRFGEMECYARVETEFGVDRSDISAFMKGAGENVRVNQESMTLIKELKKSNKDLKIYGMTNTPKPEQRHVHSTCELWPIFDHLFISSDVGMRKPDFCFYKHVLDRIGLPSDSVIFVDDSQENMVSALALGMKGITFTSHDDLQCRLLNILYDPVQRGQYFLKSSAKQLHSITNNGHVIRDNFAQLIILEMTHQSDLVELECGNGLWNYFIGDPQLTTVKFLNDFDTTALALSILPSDHGAVRSVMDEMITYTSEDGIIMTYFDRTRPRVDPFVCVNVLNLFLKYGREDELKPTWGWVLTVLENRAYLNGTRYYSSAEPFLFFLARLSESLGNSTLRNQLLPTPRARLIERIGEAGDSAALAMRVLACKMLKIPNQRDMDKLKALQCIDGGWPAGSIYKYGVSGLTIGNRGFVTSIALRAIEMPEPTSDVIAQPSSFGFGISLFAMKDVVEKVIRKNLSSLGFLSAAGPGPKK